MYICGKNGNRWLVICTSHGALPVSRRIKSADRLCLKDAMWREKNSEIERIGGIEFTNWIVKQEHSCVTSERKAVGIVCKAHVEGQGHREERHLMSR